MEAGRPSALIAWTECQAKLHFWREIKPAPNPAAWPLVALQLIIGSTLLIGLLCHEFPLFGHNVMSEPATIVLAEPRNALTRTDSNSDDGPKGFVDRYVQIVDVDDSGRVVPPKGSTNSTKAATE
jgi:hypothetical protein